MAGAYWARILLFAMRQGPLEGPLAAAKKQRCLFCRDRGVVRATKGRPGRARVCLQSSLVRPRNARRTVKK
jgi:hypothetical protein